jgi:protein-disulfide isomerase
MAMLKSLGQSITFALVATMMLITPQTRAQPPAHAATHTATRAANWNATVTRTPDDGYILGNPRAPLHLVAYISYTCPHCAEFEEQARAPLAIGMIGPGKGSLEIRPFLRNALDVVASLLAECGPPSKFFGNTQLLLARQRDWLAPIDKLSDAQKARWDQPDFGTRMRAIASDLGLYTLMEQRGFGRADLDRCLTDKALADRLAKHTQNAVDKDGVNGTPGFLIDNLLLTATYDWAALKPQLEARLH